MPGTLTYTDLKDRGRYAGAEPYALEPCVKDTKAAGGKAAQVSTLTVDTAIASTEYAWTIAGESQTYTSGGAPSASEIATGIADVINQDLDTGGIVEASASSNVVTITATTKGESFTISESDGNLSLATTTSADEGDDIPYGCAVVLDGSATDECRIPDTSSLGDKVVTLTPTATNSQEYAVNITMLTGEYRGETFPAAFTSDGTATVAEITAGLTSAINDVLPANTVVATDGGTEVTLTSEIEGDDFVANGGPDITRAVTTASSNRRFLGVAARSESRQAPSSTSTETPYTDGDSVPIVRKGAVWVRFEGSDPDLDGANDQVFVRKDASSTEQLGTFRAADSDSGDCFGLPAGRAEWLSVSETGNDGQTICLLRLL